MIAVVFDVKVASAPKSPSLWRNPAFNLLWGSQAISGPSTIPAFAGVIAISALTATVSKGIRRMRPLEEMAVA